MSVIDIKTRAPFKQSDEDAKALIEELLEGAHFFMHLFVKNNAEMLQKLSAGEMKACAASMRQAYMAYESALENIEHCAGIEISEQDTAAVTCH